MAELNTKQKIALLIFGFIAAAFGGWLYEEICVYVLYHHLYNRGMLHLTICPIYGFGAWGLYFLLHKIKRGSVFFLLSTVIASVFEYLCSYLLELIFHRSYWTYRDWLFSVNDRISLISSLIFGLLAVLFAKCMIPLLQRLIRKGNSVVWFISSLIAAAVIIGDFILVIRNY